MGQNKEMKSKTIKGLFWSFTELISKQGLQLIIQVILARLLIPEHFGLIGMVMIFIAISNSLVESGLDQALIREKNPQNRDFSTVFYFNLAVSILIYLLLFLLAPKIANFFDEPQLILILRVLMIVVVINAFSVIQRVILIRKVDFKTQTKISITAGIISGSFAIILAIFGAGVWSLVAQQVMMKFVEMILLVVSNRWIPMLVFKMNLFKKYFQFGYKLLLSGLIDTIYNNIYFVIIGKMYSVTQLGYYTNATKLRDVSSKSISTAIQKVTYPVLSNIKEDNERLAINYKKLLKLTSYIYFPFILGLASIAQNLIPFLLGEQWEPSVIYFQLLCIAGILYPIHAINLNILKVKNRSDLFLLLEIVKKTILTILIVLAILLDYGVIGLILAAIANSFISLFVNTYFSAKEINYSFLQQIKDMLPSFLLANIMFLIVYYIDSIIQINLFVDLIAQIITGVILYTGLSWILKLEEFKSVTNLLKNFKK